MGKRVVLGCTLLVLAVLLSSGVLSSPPVLAASSLPNIKHRTLTSPASQTDGYFGYAVSVSSSIAVVGASDETAGGYTNAGNAYTFNAKTGAVISTLTSPNAQSGGYFGTSVAISGDTIVVGAPYETAGGYANAGNVYAFNAMTGTLISTLTSPNPQTYGLFGYSVAVIGDTVVVGAPHEDSNGITNAGNSYTFDAATGTFISTLTSPNAQFNGEFGYSVAASGKVDVVGAPGENSSGNEAAGNVYTFSAKTGALISTLTSPNAQYNGEFGVSVGASGNNIVVGANFETANGYADDGHAYTFDATTGALTNTLTSPNQQDGGWFGFSVAVSGSTVVVGAPRETLNGYTQAGRAYTFNAATGALISTLTSPDSHGGWFGYSAAASGSVVVVGAPYKAVGGHKDAGHAYIF